MKAFVNIIKKEFWGRVLISAIIVLSFLAVLVGIEHAMLGDHELDKDWKEVPFITEEKMFKLDYMQRREIEIFLPSDTSARYICTRSMLEKGNAGKSIISSKVCSKIK